MSLIILISSIILLITYFVPINVFIEHQRKNNKDELKIWMEVFFGLITYKLHIPYLELKQLFAQPLLKFKAEVEATGAPKMEIEKEKSLAIYEIDWERLTKQIKFMKGFSDQFEAIERGLDTFKDELHRLDELTLRNPILLRIIGTLVLSIKGECKKFVWKTNFGVKNPAMTGVLTGVLWSIKGTVYSFLSHNTKKMVQPNLQVQPNFNQVNKLEVDFKSIFSLKLGNIIITGAKIIFKRYKRRFSKRWQTIQLKH